MSPLNLDIQEVYISTYDTTTQTKKYFKEPAAGTKKYSNPIMVEAQVKFIDYEEQYFTDMGDQLRTTGTLIIEYDELENAGLSSLKPGDLITKINEDDCLYRITEVQKKRHFAKVYFNEAKYKIGGVR